MKYIKSMGNKVRASNLEHSPVLLPPEVGFDTAHEI